ncbi:MAG: sulfotransferase family protein [Alphaproteobacteria bacterium]|nr:sulfotransferase family protein [Alphaproteobacteria bacterium]
MIISPGRRYIFVHIPKTGGTSLSLALEGRAMRDDILIGDTPKAVRRRRRLKGLTSSGRLWKHARLSDIDGVVAGDELAAMFVFTLIRNPWDRMVSYYHWLRSQDFSHASVDLAKSLSFSDFLNHPETERAFAAERYGAYVTDASGVERCNAFVRLEHLENDLARVEAHLGFALGPLPHENRSDRPKDYRTAYSDADAARIEVLCAEDIARFGYRF